MCWRLKASVDFGLVRARREISDPKGPCGLVANGTAIKGTSGTTEKDGPSLLYIDRHIVHEVCPQAFDGLRNAGRVVRRPDCTLVTVDHNIPTVSRKNFTSIEKFIEEPNSRAQCLAVERNIKEFGLTYFGIGDKRQGIVHIIGPEQGFTLPGSTLVCGDSHTSTHGAFGSLAFGIGTSEVEHVLATQTILQQKSRNMRITVEGVLGEGVTPKDVMLHIIGHIGTAGGTGCVLEFAGNVFREMSMEGRMSVCNMSIEAGARAGLVEPDETTFAYLRGRPYAPTGDEWDKAVAHWRTLHSDTDAKFDVEVNIRAEDIVPTVTWGTSPQDVVPITGAVPDPETFSDPIKRSGVQRALKYMGLKPNTPMEEITIDKVFIGSCTNSRIEDLRSAATVVLNAGPDARVASSVYAMVVPGSGIIKEQAEAEGLDTIFKRAGFDWREAGCSMCLGMNPDQLSPGQRCASTSNRNFEGRQGAGGRTHLVSPAMAAAAALTGRLTDVRKFMRQNNNIDSANTAKLKVTNISDFLTEKALPPPAPVARTSLEQESSGAGNGAGMTKFTTLKGIAAPLHMANVDTDLIIPKQFLKTLTRSGLGDALFFALRKDPHTGEPTDFILNREPYNRAKILVVTGANFACGSSREHAVWSLMDFGIRCVVAPSIADIHKNNELQNGMLPIELSPEKCSELAKDAEEGLELEIDLEKQEIRREQGRPPVQFQIDPFRRHCLLHGIDDIGLTMQKEEEIVRFERWRTANRSWLNGVGYGARVKGTGNMEW